MTPTQQLARILHPSNSRNRLLNMIAYFDESGKPTDRPIVSLGAFVGHDLKWFKFDVKWRRLLLENKAAIHPKKNTRWLHMTDFSKREPPYNNWSETKRIKFCAAIAEAIKDTIVFGTTHSLVVKDWNEVIVPTLESPFKKKRGWYVFLMQAMLLDIEHFVKPSRYDRIACVFDENKEVSNAAECHYNGLKETRRWEKLFGPYGVDNSVFVPGLQAADVLAFEGRRAVENKVLNDNADPIRRLLENLTEKKQVTVGRYTREDLVKFHNDWMRVREYREALESDEQGES